MSLNSKLVDTDTYKTVIMGDECQGGEIVELKGETIDKLMRFTPIGYGQNITTIFRGDGTVEVYGMTPYKKKDKEDAK